MKLLTTAILLLFHIIGCKNGTELQAQKAVEGIRLPPGFSITTFAENIENARSLCLSPEGVLFVGTRTAGKVFAVVDTNKDFFADKVITIASGLNMPNGVAFRNGDLFVAEVNRIIRFDKILSRLDNPPPPVIVNDSYPSDRHHGWKFIAFGPDDKLYVPVGAPCNVCLEDDSIYASITRINPNGSGREIFASGVRNTVGFDWHPETKQLWFTDNGRDMLGDDLPPDELNCAPVAGLNFGFPFLHGKNIPDPEFGKKDVDNSFTIPRQELGPHVAALGMRFYTGTMFPEEYKNNIFIAEHGSWNRSSKIGYRVTRIVLDGDNVIKYEIFAEGWLKNEKVSGRPVDVLVMPDGSLLVSDDYAGKIYRISYK